MKMDAMNIGYILAFTIVTAFTIFALMKVSKPHGLCLGPPYIYATFHDEQTNILKYSRNGCLLSNEVLLGGPKKNDNHRTELRTMKIATYNDSKALYVADGNTDHSYLMVYGQCNQNGQRPYLATVASTEQYPGAKHMYGVTVDNRGNVYVSSQHTDNVLRFAKDTFKPMPFPSHMEECENPYLKNYPGTFMQFGLPQVHEENEQGVRSVEAVGSDIWIANKELNGVAIVDSVTGELTTIINIANPIGIHYDETNHLVFISSKLKHKRARIYGVSTKTYQIVKMFRKKHMKHPAGMVTHDDFLYVADQELGDIAKYSISKQKYLGVVAKGLPGTVEDVMISDC